MAIAAGLLLASAFPRIGMAGLAWVAPGLMLLAAIGRQGGAAFRIGYAGGMGFYLLALSWLLRIPVPITPIIGWLGLAMYLALYSGVWVWLCWKLFPAPRPGQGAGRSEGRGSGEEVVPARTPSLPGGVAEALDRFIAAPWQARLRWTLLCAALWVALEMLVGRLFSGFPWLYLGVSQYRIYPVIQIASVAGVYGVSFLLIWFSVSFASAMVLLLRHPQTRWHSQRELVAPFAVTAAVVVGGWWGLVQPAPPQPTLRVALIQPSIPQQWIWDARESSNRFQALLRLSEQALANHPDLLVWPEAAVPYMYRFDQDVHAAITNLVQKHRVWLALGSDDVAVRERPNGRLETNYFNSSFLVGPTGETKGNYRKRQLVIFGEYVPFGRDFRFIEEWTGLGSFTPGERPAWYMIPEVPARIAMLICFEDVFPHLTRTAVDEETDFVLNLTNNGWFGEGAAQWQHAANAAFRAVENGLPLVRCANNGLTCWVDSKGRMESVRFPGRSDIYGAGFKIVEVPLLGVKKRMATYYNRHGDVFGWACVCLSGVAVLGLLMRRRTELLSK